MTVYKFAIIILLIINLCLYMKKAILYTLAVFGAIFIFYLLRAMWGGFSSTVNPGAQVQKAKCIAECRNNNLSDNCDNYCFEKSLGK